MSFEKFNRDTKYCKFFEQLKPVYKVEKITYKSYEQKCVWKIEFYTFIKKVLACKFLVNLFEAFLAALNSA